MDDGNPFSKSKEITKYEVVRNESVSVVSPIDPSLFCFAVVFSCTVCFCFWWFSTSWYSNAPDQYPPTPCFSLSLSLSLSSSNLTRKKKKKEIREIINSHLILPYYGELTLSQPFIISRLQLIGSRVFFLIEITKYLYLNLLLDRVSRLFILFSSLEIFNLFFLFNL